MADEKTTTSVSSEIARAVSEAADALDPAELADTEGETIETLVAGGEGEAETEESAEATAEEEDAEEETEEDGGDTEAEAEEEDEETALSAEDLAKIRADPILSKLRKALLSDYTTKTTKLAAYRQIIKGLTEDPDRTIASLAAARGLNVAKPATEEKPADKERDAVRADVVKLFGDEHAEAVLGVIEKAARRIAAAEVAPIRQATSNLALQTQAAEVITKVGSFMREHRQEITPEIEKEMVEVGRTIAPGPEADEDSYMETLFEIVQGRRGKTAGSARVAERIKRNLAEAEPRRGISSRAAVSPKSKVGEAKDLKGALRQAFDEAWTEIAGG